MYPDGRKGVEGVGSAFGSPIVGIVDVLKVPADLPAGKYVLGWRYDCEATAQVGRSEELLILGLIIITCEGVVELCRH